LLSVWFLFAKKPMMKLSFPFQLFIVTVAAIAIGTAVVLSVQVSWGNWQEMALFFAVIVVAFSVRVPDPRGGAVTPTTVLSYLVVYLLNPPTALLVAGVGRTLGYVISKGWVPWRAVFNGSQIAISVAIGSLVFRLLRPESSHIELSSAYLALVMAPLAHQVANNFFVAYGISQVRGTRLIREWASGVQGLFLPNLLHIPTAIFLAIWYERVRQTAILAYLILLPFQSRALDLYLKRREVYAQIVTSLVLATDVNFPSGRGHARRVAELSVAIGREMGFSETSLESIQFAALLHDVGMIGKDELLERAHIGPDEAEGLRDHVRVGAEIAKELQRKEIVNLILHHHERYDGTGYPAGSRGEAIPQGARVIALAETEDSMVRGLFPYTAPSSADEIREHIVAERGRGFDPDVVDAFIRLLEQGTLRIIET
jgi:putative nucleotidyltransferase with HDIG domain